MSGPPFTPHQEFLANFGCAYVSLFRHDHGFETGVGEMVGRRSRPPFLREIFGNPPTPNFNPPTPEIYVSPTPKK